jgi:transcriptional regulator with XRE-family HTH domain
MPTEDELFASVDALLEQGPSLPPPEERKRLRKAAGFLQEDIAAALHVGRDAVVGWENGKTTPRPPRLQAYQRLLDAWAARYPAPSLDDQAPAEVPATFAPTAPPQAPVAVPPAAAPAPAAPAAASAGTARTTATAARSASTSRRPAAAKAARPAADPRFPNGPLAVLDGDGTMYCVGGVVLDCPATTIPALVDWTLSESGIGAARLHRNGKDSDPLIALTEAAAVRFGLPARLEGEEARRSLRLPDDHKVVKQITKARWKLTQRGFGPWARVYRPAKGSERQCVQLAMLSWDALDPRSWGNTAGLHPAEIANVLGVYASRVITPRGSTAVSGIELMTAMRPPTRAAKDETTGGWVSAPNPGALHGPMDPAPPESMLAHPVAQGWDGGFLDEEAFQWRRDPGSLTDAECLLPFAVGLDINTAFLAAAARLSVGLSEPEHVKAPVFDKKTPGSWYVDLSHIDIDPRLPNPFTPKGTRPTGPAWYATPTVAYAVELGATVAPLEAYLRRQTGAYLDPWHDRLKDAYVTTMGDAGIPVDKDTDEATFLAAMSLHTILRSGSGDLAAVREQLTAASHTKVAGLDDDELAAALRRHQQIAMVLSAVKGTVKGGIGKLKENPQGRHHRDGERWPALERPTWRPDIRAAVISKARVKMHRKMANVARATGGTLHAQETGGVFTVRFGPDALMPLGVLSDCVVYPSKGSSPLDCLPLADDEHVLPGTFRIGGTPGLAKVEGVQDMYWAVDLLEKGLNPARHIKGGDAVLDEGE